MAELESTNEEQLRKIKQRTGPVCLSHRLGRPAVLPVVERDAALLRSHLGCGFHKRKQWGFVKERAMPRQRGAVRLWSCATDATVRRGCRVCARWPARTMNGFWKLWKPAVPLSTVAIAAMCASRAATSAARSTPAPGVAAAAGSAILPPLRLGLRRRGLAASARTSS